jgi:hypothetical protein
MKIARRQIASAETRALGMMRSGVVLVSVD